ALVSLYHRKFINEKGNDSFARATARLNFANTFKINSTTSIDLTGRYISRTEDAFYIAYERYKADLMIQKTFFDKKWIARIYVNDLFNTLRYEAERPFENFRTFRSDHWRSRSIRFWISYNFSSKNKVDRRKNRSKNEARRRL
ncbi:MAG: outer membrane beta-barrel protein, partial [Bacteroidota bacterium]